MRSLIDGNARVLLRQPRLEARAEHGIGKRRDGPDGASGNQIVRRYREHPTPLVRDAVRNWRTGRLDAVLAGAFDLIE